MFYNEFDSPIGNITISTNGKHITSLHIEGDRYFTKIPTNWIRDAANPLLKKAEKEINEYFAKTRKKFELPIYFKGTDFQKLVWKALSQIPFGQTISYKDLAEKIGKPKAVRAVATAVGRNPLCIIVPCHRVVTSDKTLGGYVAGPKIKQQLLALEQSI